MDWKTRLELTYRGYARQHRAVEDDFTATVDHLAASLEANGCDTWVADLVLGDSSTLYVPVAEENLKKAEDRGLLILHDGPSLVVREWAVTIPLFQSFGEAEALRILELTLPEVGNVFTNIRIIREAFTDVPPQ